MLKLTTVCCVLALVGALLACEKGRDEATAAAEPAPARTSSPPNGAASGQAAPEQRDWISFTPDDKRFTVQLPTKPELESQVTPTAGGAMKFDVYSASGPFGVLYQVGFADFPKHLVAQNQPGQMLTNAQQGAVSKLAGTVVTERQLRVQGYPAREFSMRVTNQGLSLGYWGRLLLVGARLYQLQVLGLKAQAEPSKRERFFDSFKVNQP
jgi:hypothetical protein